MLYLLVFIKLVHLLSALGWHVLGGYVVEPLAPPLETCAGVIRCVLMGLSV